MTTSLLITVFVIVLLPLVVSTAIALLLFRRQRHGRRTPLTSSLLRSPGESLRQELQVLEGNLDNFLWSTMMAGGFPALVLVGLMYLNDNKATNWHLALCGGLYVALIVWHSWRLYGFLQQRQNLSLGLDAELAVGQELNHLMLQGCRVFHDFPAENFNIDHVVVGPGGVIAVETKGRAKPDKGRGSVDATVVYDGQILRFPDWHESEPLEQAKRQAEWLQKWLGSAVGESVPVKPALALPGWFIERTKSGSVFIFNGKNPVYLAKPLETNAPMDPQMIQRIAHQLEQRCRDVEPVAYRKEKKP